MLPQGPATRIIVPPNVESLAFLISFRAILTGFWADFATLGPFGAFWVILGPFWPFWGHFGHFMPFWAILEPFWPFWAILGHFGHLGPF